MSIIVKWPKTIDPYPNQVEGWRIWHPSAPCDFPRQKRRKLPKLVLTLKIIYPCLLQPMITILTRLILLSTISLLAVSLAAMHHEKALTGAQIIDKYVEKQEVYSELD